MHLKLELPSCRAASVRNYHTRSAFHLPPFVTVLLHVFRSLRLGPASARVRSRFVSPCASRRLPHSCACVDPDWRPRQDAPRRPHVQRGHTANRGRTDWRPTATGQTMRARANSMPPGGDVDAGAVGGGPTARQHVPPAALPSSRRWRGPNRTKMAAHIRDPAPAHQVGECIQPAMHRVTFRQSPLARAAALEDGCALMQRTGRSSATCMWCSQDVRRQHLARH